MSEGDDEAARDPATSAAKFFWAFGPLEWTTALVVLGNKVFEKATTPFVLVIRRGMGLPAGPSFIK